MISCGEVTVDMARALAYAGGIGFIHRDQPEASQAEMVAGREENTAHQYPSRRNKSSGKDLKKKHWLSVLLSLSAARFVEVFGLSALTWVFSSMSEVKQVKNTEHGFILDPVTLGPYDMVSDVDQLKATRGCTAVPITDNRRIIRAMLQSHILCVCVQEFAREHLCSCVRIGGKLMGLVTARDVEGIVDRKATRLGTIMVPVKDASRHGAV
eukprot:3128259-Amphidinium_carterae.1